MAIQLSVAPIAWSNDDLPELGGTTPVETILAESRSVGFTGTELGGRYPQDKEGLKTLLDKHDIKLSSGWFSGNLLDGTLDEEKARLDKEIEKRKHVGCDIIVYCECSNTIQCERQTPISKKPVLSNDEMKSFAQKYTELSKHAREQGVTLAYHFHMGTIIQTAEELDALLHYAGDDVKITYDTGHMFFSGGDPLKEMQKHMGQTALVHLKDVRKDVRDEVISSDKSFLDAVLGGVYTVPGDGSIDFDPIVKTIKEAGYEGWVVVEAEQDPEMAHPLTYAQKTYGYLMDLFNKHGIEVKA